MIKSLEQPSNTHIIVARKYDTPFSELSAMNNKYGDGTERFSNKTIVGWSRGAQGLSKTMDRENFKKIIYADPSPGFLLGKNHGIAKMYYKLTNWPSDEDQIAKGKTPFRRKLSALAAEMGSNAQKSDGSHKEIFKQSILELMFGSL
jgi:hypothetical protein